MTTEQRLARIENLLTELVKEKRKTTWVNGHVVSELTGWGGEKMRQMREMGVLKFKRTGKQSISYDLDSIPEKFIIQQSKIV